MKKAYLFIVDPFHVRHIDRIRGVFKGHKVALFHKEIKVFSELAYTIQKYEKLHNVEICGIVLSHTALLKKLLVETFNSVALDKIGKSDAISTNYQGAMFNKSIGGKDYPVVVFPELKSIAYRPYAEFLLKRYFAKLHDPKFPMAPKCTYEEVDENNAAEYLEVFRSALLIGGDIETYLEEVPFWVLQEPEYKGIAVQVAKRGANGNKLKKKIAAIPKISLQGYTGIFKNDDGILESITIVLRINSEKMIDWMKKFNDLPAPKLYQNGKYDTSYHLRYDAPMRNYVYDSHIMMHSWYAELPRTLGFISSMFLKNHMYWKDESAVNAVYYNAQDCHNMTWATMFLLQEWPKWAQENYRENFPMIFPCISCNATGVLIDKEEEARLKVEEERKIETAKSRLETLTGIQYFNANSSKQVVGLMNVLGYATKKSDKAAQVEFRDKSELTFIYAEAIRAAREASKAISNYFEIDLFEGRMLYSLGPAGTDSGRFSCHSSDFWCGTQIQNIPFYAKSMVVPDKGFVFGAMDNSQSESRCTGYMSEDLNLINNVETAKDFHTKNASMFFGLDEDYLNSLKKDDPALFKTYRNEIGKKVNHGANYNMGPKVLLQNMGRKAVFAAARALKLPYSLNAIEICAHLLSLFDKTYPLIRDLNNPDSYYSKVIAEVEETSMLVGPTGWTRYCFGDPSNSKPELNSYVAHGPQSLSVKLINQAFFKSWKKLQIEENLILMIAQIHDENFFQYLEEFVGTEKEKYIFETMSDFMKEPVVIHGRTMIIPNDWAMAGKNWSECK